MGRRILGLFQVQALLYKSQGPFVVVRVPGRLSLCGFDDHRYLLGLSDAEEIRGTFWTSFRRYSWHYLRVFGSCTVISVADECEQQTSDIDRVQPALSLVTSAKFRQPHDSINIMSCDDETSVFQSLEREREYFDKRMGRLMTVCTEQQRAYKLSLEHEDEEEPSLQLLIEKEMNSLLLFSSWKLEKVHSNRWAKDTII